MIGQPASLIRAAWLNDPGTGWPARGRCRRSQIGDGIVSRWRGYRPGWDTKLRRLRLCQRLGDGRLRQYAVTVVADPANPGATTTTYTLNTGQTAYVRGSANQPPISIYRAQRSTRIYRCRCRCVRATAARPTRAGPTHWCRRALVKQLLEPGIKLRHRTERLPGALLPPQNNRNLAADVDIYIYNPGTASLPVTYEGPGGTGIITISPGSTGSYLKLRFPTELRWPA